MLCTNWISWLIVCVLDYMQANDIHIIQADWYATSKESDYLIVA